MGAAELLLLWFYWTAEDFGEPIVVSVEQTVLRVRTEAVLTLRVT